MRKQIYATPAFTVVRFENQHFLASSNGQASYSIGGQGSPNEQGGQVITNPPGGGPTTSGAREGDFFDMD